MSDAVLVPRAVLERLEWSGAVLRHGMPVNACPCCRAVCDMTKPDSPHYGGCLLATALAAPDHVCPGCVLCAIRAGALTQRDASINMSGTVVVIYNDEPEDK